MIGVSLIFAIATAPLLFSDDAVRFPPDWIVPRIAPIVAGRADAVAGGVRLAPPLLRPWMGSTRRRSRDNPTT